jgi:SAM-dependent methyltransferase
MAALTAIWTREWAARRSELLADALGTQDTQQLFAQRSPLPAGFGQAMDERVVEWPWILANAPRGRVLDAGSTLNHAEVLQHVLPAVDDLHIVTLQPEESAFTRNRVSYVFSDLRELPYRDGWFDCVVSISTLEHVGMDNARYGTEAARSQAADPELDRALGELRRVVRPGGELLITVPYGRPDDLGWFRVFDRAMVERMVDVLAPSQATIDVFAYDAEGWSWSTLDAAAGAVYREHTLEPAPADLAPNARAVACVRAVV